MKNSSKPIGVMDSGMGGLTVVAKLKEILPNEDIIYFGDSIHCPYGLKSQKKVLLYTKKISNFFLQNKVKAIVIACNTISTQIASLNYITVPVFEIISPICQAFADSSVKQLGVIATPFTVKSRCYDKLLSFYNPDLSVTEAPSLNLATIIESGDFNFDAIDTEITVSMQPICEKNIKDVILGCTHYPLAIERFQKLYPNCTFYDPALFEVEKLKQQLSSMNLLNEKKEKGYFSYCTSGYSEFAMKVVKNLNLPYPDMIKSRQIL